MLSTYHLKGHCLPELDKSLSHKDGSLSQKGTNTELTAGDVPVASNHLPNAPTSSVYLSQCLPGAECLTHSLLLLEFLGMGWQDFCGVKDGALGNGPTPQGLPAFQAQLPERGVCWT